MHRMILVVCLAFTIVAGQDTNAQAVPASSATQASSAPVSIRVELASPLKLEPIAPVKLDAGPPSPWWSFWVPVVGPLVTGVLGFFGVYLGLALSAKNTSKTLDAARVSGDAAIWQKANEAELAALQKKLDEFYVPFQLLSNANRLIADDLKARQPADYRMLTKLFDAPWRASLSAGDTKLVEIVCANGEELRQIIATKAGLVDEQVLPYLSQVAVHFRILSLAYDSKLGSDPVRFEHYLYPRELDAVLDLEIERLRNRMALLRYNPSSHVLPMPPLEIPPEHRLRSLDQVGN